MINIVTLLQKSADPANEEPGGAGELFSPRGPSRMETIRDLLRQLAKHDGDPATAGLRDEDDDQWIADDMLKSMAAVGLIKEAYAQQVIFYTITEEGEAYLQALNTKPPFV